MRNLKLRAKTTIFTKREIAKLVKAGAINQLKRHFCLELLARNKERKFYSDEDFYFLESWGHSKIKLLVNYVDLAKIYDEPAHGSRILHWRVEIVAVEVDFGNIMLGSYIRVRLYKDGVVWVDKYERGWNANKGCLVAFSCSLTSHPSY